MADSFAICEYFCITPIEFLDQKLHSPGLLGQTVDVLAQLSEDDLELIRQTAAKLLK